MAIWEYRTAVYARGDMGTVGLVEGPEGWEAYAVVWDSLELKFLVFFKRRKNPFAYPEVKA